MRKRCGREGGDSSRMTADTALLAAQVIPKDTAFGTFNVRVVTAGAGHAAVACEGEVLRDRPGPFRREAQGVSRPAGVGIIIVATQTDEIERVDEDIIAGDVLLE